MFLEDCTKYQDYLHLHSFSYDFHLRQIQQYMAGRYLTFYLGYPIHKLLRDITDEFSKQPSYACCHLSQGNKLSNISVTDLPVKVTLYMIEYFSKNTQEQSTIGSRSFGKTPFTANEMCTTVFKK